MTRLRVLTAQEIEDPELRATMEKVGEDVALGIYGYRPDLFKPFSQFLGRAKYGGPNGIAVIIEVVREAAFRLYERAMQYIAFLLRCSRRGGCFLER
jgi:hypothetical protein